MDKKGASVIISYVLVIGLSVSLAIAVGLWSRGESEKVVKTTVDEAEAEIKCVDVFIGGFKETDENTGIVTLKVKNRGSFTIFGFRYVCTGNDGFITADKIDIELSPGKEETLNIENKCNLNEEITLTPFIKIGDNNSICPEKKKIIEK
ncbi:MAG: hypothetical protein AABW46_03070 [Nanoarchaeota archaeon]